ncbi:MAG: dienelactone hydrolase family protein [Rhodocyclaceae bacterium]|nr:dienelactone hydrolase family protein [Rhodocyclaceae bacterium]
MAHDPQDPQFDSLFPTVTIDRRAFVVTALGAGFALAVRPVSAQTVITTSSADLVTGPIKVPTRDGMLPAFQARPAAARGKLPTVLVVHEIFGVHEYIQDVCRRLAKAGYLAIAAEMYARHGDVAKIPNVQDILDGPVAMASDAEHMADLDACTAWAAANGGDPGRLAVTGFCRGGRTTWLYAAHGATLKAAVAWYGSLEGPPTARQPKHPLDLAGELKAPVLGLYGGADQGIDADQVADMQDQLRKAGGRSVIHVYPDAPHAFHADHRGTYRRAEAEDGWRRMLEWFRIHGV